VLRSAQYYSLQYLEQMFRMIKIAE
jgi:hypothetical protein